MGFPEFDVAVEDGAGAIAFLGAQESISDLHHSWWFMAVAACVSAFAALALPGRTVRG